MRFAGRVRLGFYPLPIEEARRIRGFLRFPNELVSALDPCIGNGCALAEIGQDAQAVRYGIELEANRAKVAANVADEVIHGNCFDVQVAVESFSLLYMNPPYDCEIGADQSQRMEKLFLEHTYRWLKRGGVLVFVIPSRYICDCAPLLAQQFRDLQVYRLREPECVKYKQAVLFGVRRTRQERERQQDADIARTRSQLEKLSLDWERLEPMPMVAERQYSIPCGAPVRMTYRGLPLDQIEDLLTRSSAYRQAAAILFAPEMNVLGRPLTPLHGGHVGILCTAGLLNGVFGEGEDRHIAHWQSVKVVDKSEEDEDGTMIIREKERFSNELTLVFGNGRTATLK